MVRACSTLRKTGRAYRVLVGKPNTKHRCKDNIKVDHRVVGWGSMDRIYRDMWRALMNAVMNLRVT